MRIFVSHLHKWSDWEFVDAVDWSDEWVFVYVWPIFAWYLFWAILYLPSHIEFFGFSLYLEKIFWLPLKTNYLCRGVFLLIFYDLFFTIWTSLIFILYLDFYRVVLIFFVALHEAPKSWINFFKFLSFLLHFPHETMHHPFVLFFLFFFTFSEVISLTYGANTFFIATGAPPCQLQTNFN